MTFFLACNYDWKQDLKLLAKHLHELGVKEFSLASPNDVGYSICERGDYLEAGYDLSAIKAVIGSAAARREGRTLSQLCEILLAGGLETYKKEGAKCLQRILSHYTKEPSP